MSVITEKKFTEAGLASAVGRVSEMKKIGQERGWVIPQTERRVHKLLLMQAREREHEFVTRCASMRRKRAARIKVEFAGEELSEFEVLVQIVLERY